ncbi:MAG: hypothetical protein L0Z53_26820, partial [Acidobacteriales bacterium]|nr:hypothetical protein [Terriglobales bacterium]
ESEREEWLKENAAEGKKLIEEQEKKFDLIAKWLAQQKLDKKQRDMELEEEGSKAFFSKTYGNCSSCHTAEGYLDKRGKGDFKYEEKGGSDGPSFVDYGSAAWIRFMVMNPAHPSRYVKENFMPAFRNLDGPGSEVHKQEFMDTAGETPVLHLSDVDRELIIRWMMRDYRAVFGGQTISAPPRKE